MIIFGIYERGEKCHLIMEKRMLWLMSFLKFVFQVDVWALGVSAIEMAEVLLCLVLLFIHRCNSIYKTF